MESIAGRKPRNRADQGVQYRRTGSYKSCGTQSEANFKKRVPNITRSQAGRDRFYLERIPAEWLHATDELYGRMRGSADHMHVLSSSYSKPEFGGTDMHEPMVWFAPFNKGRVVTTSMGHIMAADTSYDALHCVGFQTILARSTEWAATGKVTLPVPEGFPTLDKTSVIEPSKVNWKK